jgi:DNA-binding NtrC family response regulator
MTAARPTVLIVDDDPLHITLYKWMMGKEGFNAVGAQVQSDSVDWPDEQQVDVVLLDYRLNSALTAPNIANMARQRYAAPIIVLSEMPWLPDDMRERAEGFVRKGEPAQLMETVAKALARNENSSTSLP